MRENVLSIHVKIDEAFDVCGNGVTVNLVNFHGTAESDFFSGEILPGGVDTQTYIEGEPGRLSARYMLEGKDCLGKKCRIFIENNGTNSGEKIVTKPKIVTDSKELAWLMSAELEGQVISEPDGICIEIFMK